MVGCEPANGSGVRSGFIIHLTAANSDPPWSGMPRLAHADDTKKERPFNAKVYFLPSVYNKNKLNTCSENEKKTNSSLRGACILLAYFISQSSKLL